MVNQNKNPNTLSSRSTEVATRVGLVVMLAASCLSMAELAEHEGNRIVAALQPSYSFASQATDPQGHGDEMTRRSKEEIGHASASYGSARRSESVSGNI